MVIGFDAKRAFQNSTGLGNYSRILICGLAQEHQDIRAFLYSPHITGEYAKYFTGFANISTRIPSSIDRFFPDIWRRFGVTVHLRGDKVKIFHGLSHELPHGIPRSIKRVVTMHDLIVWRYPEFYKPFDRMVYRIKQRHSCRIADAVVAISEQTKRDLIEYLHVPESKIKVIYQSCDPMFWNAIPDSDIEYVRKTYNLPEKYIICVGSIEERKNQVAVVKAMTELPDDVHLVIVGKNHGGYQGTLTSAIRSHNLTQRVHILKDADFEDFPALYAGAVASAYMSFFEGFGIPILEAMCSGTPVVTSNVSSMPEAGGDAVLYADPKNPSEIAAQLKRIIEDPALRQQLVEKGKVQCQNFSQHKIIGDLYQLYTSLVPETDSE
jgi:glycosyltransferase involved in cell wall biosynthesis